ncbi:hypothetical protein DFJ74DRAFT_689307 [Hyaloraphidium curvatum]|nr:hypothetical protein DFJ74DRAFT_689307 [Hyaloraphidium curvatum]
MCAPHGTTPRWCISASATASTRRCQPRGSLASQAVWRPTEDALALIRILCMSQPLRSRVAGSPDFLDDLARCGVSNPRLLGLLAVPGWPDQAPTAAVESAVTTTSSIMAILVLIAMERPKPWRRRHEEWTSETEVPALWLSDVVLHLLLSLAKVRNTDLLQTLRPAPKQLRRY